MKFENAKVFGFENAVIGARLPMCRSFDEAQGKCDATSCESTNCSMCNPNFVCDDFIAGDKDIDLLKRLIKADENGSSQPNSKFLRMIHCQVCITAPVYFFAELDTYKVGTTRNSSSVMHKGVSEPYRINNFTIDNGMDEEDMEWWQNTVHYLNTLRDKYLETKDFKYFRKLRQALPMGYNYVSMMDLDYATLRNMYYWRCKHPHRLTEWSKEFKAFVETLPYSELITC